MKDKQPAQLGDEVKDSVSGFRGVVVAVTDWLNGCKRITVQPPIKKDGTLPGTETFDAEQINVVHAGRVKATPSLTGGPKQNPARHPQPTERR